MSRVALALVMAASGSGVALSVSADRRAYDAVVQPIAFNHLVHAKRGIACADCHQGVETSAKAWIPRVALCIDCHSEDTTTTPEKEKMKSIAAAGREIPWERLYRLPAHVVFSHERHVAMGGVACDACHGAHGQSEAPPTHADAVFPEMTACLACHAVKGAAQDCVACHR